MLTHIAWIKNNISEAPELYRISGNVYYSAMLYKQAEEDYRKAIEKDPENSRLHQSLADCLVAQGDYDNAQDYYDKSIELYKKDGQTDSDSLIKQLKTIRGALPKKYKDIDELIQKGNYLEAQTLCKERISLNPADYAAITQLGDIYWRRGNRRMATKLFRKVARLIPDYPIAHFFLGRAYIFEGNHKKGVSEFNIFKEKMETLPKMDEITTNAYVSYLSYIAYIYFTQKEYRKAEKVCKKIVQLNPDDQIAHYNLAVCYYQYHHNRQRAYNELQKVIAIDPSTKTSDMARFYTDYIRRNPDSRFVEDFSFMYEDD